MKPDKFYKKPKETKDLSEIMKYQKGKKADDPFNDEPQQDFSDWNDDAYDLMRDIEEYN